MTEKYKFYYIEGTEDKVSVLSKVLQILKRGVYVAFGRVLGRG